MRLRVAVTWAALALMVGACSGDVSRSEVTNEIAYGSIVPRYEQLDAAASELAEANAGLCAGLSEAGLTASRSALAQMERAWKTTETMWLGPVMERRSWAVIDWPIDALQIEELLGNPAITDLSSEYLGTSIGADQRGLEAVEYILGTDDLVTLGDLEDARRCEYLVSISQVMNQETALLVGDWAVSWEGEVPYAEVVAQAEMNTSFNPLVNDMLFLLAKMRDDGIVDASELLARTEGISAVLLGGEATMGLDELLSDDLGERLAVEVSSIQGAQNEQTPEHLKTLQMLVATEVVSQLGVTIGFSDADGDTG